MRKYFLILSGLILLMQCKPARKQEKPSAPLFDNLGEYRIEITTKSELAEKYFNQGLKLTYGFNHPEAIRSFKEAIRQDSTCAMCYFGIAYCLGPNINAAMKDKDVEEAYTSSQKAVQFSEHVTEWEKAAIKALSERYSSKIVEDRSKLDLNYSEAMKMVFEKFPDLAEVGTWYAESMMDLHPWNYWTKEGNPQPWTPAILETLDSVLKKHPDHPGANHMYIHATEASGTPEKGLKSANKLATLVPGAGHLIHMPSHTYIRTGDYHKGTEVNEAAAKADSTYIANCNAKGTYPLLHFPHIYHFLAATAALEGRGKRAIEAAYQVANNTDIEEMKKGNTTLQHYYTIPYYVLTKFGQWDYILNIEEQIDSIQYLKAIRHYSRGMAFLGKSKLSESEKELKALKEIEKDTILKHLRIWETNSVDNLVQIASKVLESQILERKGFFSKSINLLKDAVKLEDNLTYQEPPDWFFSVRQTLGNVLLNAKKYDEAETVYMEDLKIYRENGWALNGLYQSLLKQGKQKEAEIVMVRFEKAWKYADISLSNSAVKPIVYQFNEESFKPRKIFAAIKDVATCRKN